MGGDGAANAEVSGSEREGERGRSDARVEPVSGSVDDAERPEADVPPGLWQFAGKKLREAYFHAARASVRDLELNPRPARDDDRLAADPPDPEPGVRRVLSAIRDLAVAAAEMAFAGRTGVDADLSALGEAVIAPLFNEELGALVQVSDDEAFAALLAEHGLDDVSHRIGTLNDEGRIRVSHGGQAAVDIDLLEAFGLWTETSHQIQRLRDNPVCADQEREWLLSPENPGLTAKLSFEPSAAPALHPDPLNP